ncbi:hypothetical protein BGW41_005221 [Actinomortierella wolfii]|nr:hypothetical protein BGW41_005221 [Actinomortierella wolfii]
MGATSSRLSGEGVQVDGRTGQPYTYGQYQRRQGRGGGDRNLSDVENGYSPSDHRGPGDLYPSDFDGEGTDSDDDSEYESFSEDDEYAEADELYDDDERNGNDDDNSDNRQRFYHARGPYDRGSRRSNWYWGGGRGNARHRTHSRRDPGRRGWAMSVLDSVAARMRPAISNGIDRARSAVTGVPRSSFQMSNHHHPQRHQRYFYGTRSSRQPSYLQRGDSFQTHGTGSSRFYRPRHGHRRRFGYGRRRVSTHRREVRHGYDYHPIYFGPAFRPVVEQSPEQVQLQRLLEHQLEQQQREDLQRRRERQQRRQQQMQQQGTNQEALDDGSPSDPVSNTTTARTSMPPPQHIQKDKLLYYRNNHLYNLISGLSVNPLLTEIQKAGTLDLKSLEMELEGVEGGWVDMDDEEESDEDRQGLTEEEEYLRKQGIARELQPTKRSPTALACPVNLKKSTIRLVKNTGPLAPSKHVSGHTGGTSHVGAEDSGASTGTVPSPQASAPFQPSVLGLPNYRLDFVFDSLTPCDIKLFWVTKEVEELIMTAPDDDDDEGDVDDENDESSTVFLGFRLKRLFHLPQPTVYHFDAGLNQRFVSPILPLYNLSLPELTMQGLPSAAMRMLEKQRYREERRWRRRRQQLAQQQLRQQQQRNQQRGVRRSTLGGGAGAGGLGGDDPYVESTEYLVDVEPDGSQEQGHSMDAWETDSEDEQLGLDGSSDFSLNKSGIAPGRHGRSIYTPKKLPVEEQYYPLIIVIESKKQAGDPRASKTLACDTPGLYLIENQAISTFCSFHISTEGGFELKVMKQKVWMNANHYLIQEIYGFTDATPNTAIAATTPSQIPSTGAPTAAATAVGGAGVTLPTAPAPATLRHDTANGVASSSSHQYGTPFLPPMTPTGSMGLNIGSDNGNSQYYYDDNNNDGQLPQFTKTSATPLSAEEVREQQAMEARAKRLSRSLSRQSRAESVMTRMTELLSESAAITAAEPSSSSTSRLPGVLQDSALPRSSWESQRINDIEDAEENNDGFLAPTSPISLSHPAVNHGERYQTKDKGLHEDSKLVQQRHSASTLMESEATQSPVPSSPVSSSAGPAAVAGTVGATSTDPSSLLAVGGHPRSLRHRVSISSMGSTAADDQQSGPSASILSSPGNGGGSSSEGEVFRSDDLQSPNDSQSNLTPSPQPDPSAPSPQSAEQPQQQQQQPQVNTVLLDAPECVICLTDVKDTLVLPCRHFCICNECADVLRRRTPQRCPICRQEFHALIHLASLPSSNKFFFESARPSLDDDEEEGVVGAEYEHVQPYPTYHDENEGGTQRYQPTMAAPEHISFSQDHTFIRA